MIPRTIFIWDVHGCIDELRELMETLAPTPEDRVIFLGDLINKGPDSVGVVRYVYEHGYECVLGNNDLFYIKGYETSPKYQEYHSRLSPEIHNWLVSLPSYIEWDEFIAVHGWVVPEIHPKDTDREITCNGLYWDTKNDGIGGIEHTPWYEVYTGQKKIIYGHWSLRWLTLREHTVGIDTNCCRWYQLTAYVLETAEIVQVNAKQVYHSSNIK